MDRPLACVLRLPLMHITAAYVCALCCVNLAVGISAVAEWA